MWTPKIPIWLKIAGSVLSAFFIASVAFLLGKEKEQLKNLKQEAKEQEAKNVARVARDEKVQVIYEAANETKANIDSNNGGDALNKLFDGSSSK